MISKKLVVADFWAPWCPYCMRLKLQFYCNKILTVMPRLGAIEKEEVKSTILVCRARGYNYKQILSVVNDSLRKYNNSVSEKSHIQYSGKDKERCSGMAEKSFSR